MDIIQNTTKLKYKASNTEEKISTEKQKMFNFSINCSRSIGRHIIFIFSRSYAIAAALIQGYRSTLGGILLLFSFRKRKKRKLWGTFSLGRFKSTSQKIGIKLPKTFKNHISSVVSETLYTHRPQV